MDPSEILPLISRWLHMLPAIILVGGTLFMRLAVAPVASAGTASPTAELRESIRRRWAKWVMISAGLLLVTGLYNTAIKAIGYELSGLYNGLLLVKMILAFAVFYLTAVLSGRSERAKRFRESEMKWLNILCVLMLAIVLIAGYMKLDSANAPKKVRDAAAAVVGPEIAEAPAAALNAPLREF